MTTHYGQGLLEVFKVVKVLKQTHARNGRISIYWCLRVKIECPPQESNTQSQENVKRTITSPIIL